MSNEQRPAELVVPPEDEGERLDRFLAAAAPDLSRAAAKRLIDEGHVLVDGKRVKPSHALSAGQKVSIDWPTPAPTTELLPEAIPLRVVYEDADLVVVDKPPGMPVHPAPGHPRGTLVNALLHHCGALAPGGGVRPGIVHRLDMDTSGLMVVAKTDLAYRNLWNQVRERTLERRYLALVYGELQEQRGSIDAPIGRSLADRKRMAVTGLRSRPARTDFVVLERFGAATLLEARLRTGRTHQIRVHMAFIGHPVVGDKTYGSRALASVRPDLRSVLAMMNRQALHAHRVEFHHPRRGDRLIFHAPLPGDMEKVLGQLRDHTSRRGRP